MPTVAAKILGGTDEELAASVCTERRPEMIS